MGDGSGKTPAIVDWVRRTFRAFRYRDFRLLWLGAFTSTTGTWMQMVAQSWVVLQLTGSAFYLGLVSFLGQLPIILFSLIGGAFADRVDRRRLLLLSQYVQMGVAILLTILVAGGWVEVWHFLALVFVAGSGQAFGGPAYQALLPSLVDREDVPNAVALNSIQFNLARMVGPVLAGGAFAAFGAAVCFGLNALSFLVVILALLAICSKFIPARRQANLIQDIGQGFRYVRSRGALWQLTILGFASTFCGVPLLTLLPVFAKEIFGLDAAGYSYMMAVSGAGSIVGAVLYAGYSRRTRQGRFTLRMQLVLALLIALFACSRELWLSCLVLFLGGAGLISLFAAITSLVQLATEEGMRGRMMSIFMLAFRGGMPLGDLLAGSLAATFSPTAALLVLAGLLVLVSLGVQFSRAGVTRL